MIDTYSSACTEVLVILKYYLSKSEFEKIPREKIEFFERNKDKNYDYKINKNLPLEKQDISEMANSIIITLYRDYFATNQQKEILNKILILNDAKKEKQKKIKYKQNVFENISKVNKNIQKIEQKSLVKVESNNILKRIKKIIDYIISKMKNK